MNTKKMIIYKCNPPKTNKRGLLKYYDKAKALLCNEKKMEKFLVRLENKLRKIPKCGGKLAYAPVFASLLNNYFHKTYTKVPVGTIIAALAALMYLVVPIDAIPDFIVGLGYLDDAGVMVACVALIKSDVDEYQEWRISQANKSKASA